MGIENDDLPADYRRHESGAIFRLTDGGELVEVSPVPIRIVGREIDHDSGAVHLVLAWTVRGQWVERRVPRSSARSTGRIQKLADYDFPVSSQNAREIVAYLVAAEQLALRVITDGRVASRLGWLGSPGPDTSFLWGENTVGSAPIALNVPRGFQRAVAGLRAKGMLDGWQRDVWEQVEDHPAVVAGVLAALVPLILPTLPEAEAFTFEWAAPTGSGKTTAMRVAASVWGDPSRIIAPWNTTRVGVESRLHFAGALPVFLDDTKACAWKHEVPQLIYDVTAGTGRTRGTKDGGVSAIKEWRTILLSTGEEPATSFSQDSGARARAVCWQGSPFGETSTATAALVKQVTKAVHAHHGHVGPAVVSFIQGSEGVLDGLSERYWSARERWSCRHSAPAADRVAGHFALLEIAGELLAASGVVPAFDAQEVLLPVWEHVAETFEEVDPGVRALQQVWAWVNNNEHRFYGRAEARPSSGWVGAWDADPNTWDLVAMLPDSIKVALAGDFDSNGIIRAWDAKGWLLRADEKRRARKVTVGTSRRRCICIRRQAFVDIDEVEPFTVKPRRVRSISDLQRE